MEKLTNPAAERAVLSGIYQYGSEAYFDVADILQTSSFSDETTEALYKCFKHIFENDPDSEVDFHTLISTAKSLGFSKIVESTEERKYLRSLQNMSIQFSNIRKFAAQLRTLQIRKQLLGVADEIRSNIESASQETGVSELLLLAEEPLFNFQSLLNDGGENEASSFGDGVEEYIEYLASNPREMVGLSTGYKYYDKAIGGGLRRKTVSVVGSRIKVGKTYFVDNVGIHIAKNLNIPALNIDTEMDKEQHWNRILAHLSGVTSDDIETGFFAKDKEKLRKVREAAKILKSIPYDYICINGMPFEDVLSKLRRWITKKVGVDENGRTKDCVLIYDYIKLMTADGLTGSNALQEYQMLGFMMTSLHNFTVRYDVPCLAFIQLNRDGITKESTDAAAGSDRIMWLCANFSIFKEKSDEEIAEDGHDAGNRKLVPVIARHGKGLARGDYINMQFDGDIGVIKELGLRSDIIKKNKSKSFEVSDDIFEEDPFQ